MITRDAEVEGRACLESTASGRGMRNRGIADTSAPRETGALRGFCACPSKPRTPRGERRGEKRPQILGQKVPITQVLWIQIPKLNANRHTAELAIVATR